MHICIFEDTHVKNFYPLTYLRPVYDLHLGTRSLRERIEDAFPSKHILYHSRLCLAGHLRESYGNRPVNDFPDEDTWFINGRMLEVENIEGIVQGHDGKEQVFLCGNSIALAFIKRKHIGHLAQQLQTELFHRNLFDSLNDVQVPCQLAEYPWEMMNRNANEIEGDHHTVFKKRKRSQPTRLTYKGTHLLNRKQIIVGSETTIKPGAVLDAEHGPIILGEHVTIMPNSFIEGPTFIGNHTTIKAGAKIYHGTSIGDWCKIGGEVENSIVLSYSNKQHEGYLGHSYVGSWVNIGAGTNNSDLKNTYGPVKVILGSRTIDTGLQFVGLTMGDHSKTGISMMFDTGTIVGMSCNLYGTGLPPKFIPSFSWGSTSSLSVFDLEKSVEIARRVMERRNVRMTEAYEALLRHVFAQTEDERREAVVS